MAESMTRRDAAGLVAPAVDIEVVQRAPSSRPNVSGEWGALFFTTAWVKV